MTIKHNDIEIRNKILKSIQTKISISQLQTNAILRIDVNGVVRFASPEVSNLLRENSYLELRSNSSIFEIIPTKDLELFGGKLHKAILGKISYFRLKNSSDETQLYFRLTPVFDELGIISSIDVIMSPDKLENNKKTENQLREILENASIGILLTKPSGIILDSNKAANEMFGYTKSELIKLHREVLFGKTNLEMEGFLKDRYSQGHASGEFIATRKDGTEIPVQVFSTVYENEEQELLTSTVILNISDKKDSERDLIKTTEILDSLFNRHPDAVYSFDLQGKFISINQSGLDLSEGSLDEILQRDFESMIPEEDLPKVWDHFQRASKGEIQNYNSNFISYKGTKKLINITNFPIVSNNEITGVFGIARDITVVEESKKKIAESEKKYKNILDQSQDIICTVSRKGVFLEVSAASKQIWGYTPQELTGLSYNKVIFPEDLLKTQEVWYECIKGAIVTNFLNRYIHKDGRIIPVIWSVKWNEKEQIMYCVAKDASQIKLAEEKIIEDRNMLRAIIDNIPDYIFVINDNHETILTNKKFYTEYLGKYSEKETLKLRPIDYFPIEEGEEIMRDNQKVMDSGIPVINREDIIYDHNGEKEVISLSKVPFKRKDNIIGLVGIGRNITETYNLQQEQKLIYQIIELINSAENYKSGLIATINEIREYFKFDNSEAWEVGFAKNYIRLITTCESENFPEDSVEFKELKYGEDLPGSTWKDKKVNVLGVHQQENHYQNLSVGVPVNVEDETIAVFTFYSSKEKIWDDNLSERLSRIVFQISSSIHRKSTEGQLNNMFNYSPNLIAIIGTDGYLKEINPAFRNVFGYEKDELLHTPFSKFLHPTEVKETLSRLEEVANGRTSNSFHTRCLAKDDTWKWISWTPSNVIEEKGILYLFGIDITPIKSANLELLKYKNIIESSKNGIGLIDFQTEDVFINKALKNMMGSHASNIKNLQAVKKMYGDPELVEEVFTHLNAGEYWNGDIKLSDKNGNTHDFHLNAGPVFNENHELVALFALHTDISDRKFHEAALKKYNYQINNILENITDGFFSIDKNWKVTYWNKEAERLLNIPKPAILNKNLNEFYEQNDSLFFYAKLKKAFTENKKISYEEFIAEKDQWFEVNIYPGNEGLSVYFKDITDRKKVDEEVRIAKERYDLVSRATQEAVYDWDIKKNILEWSEAYYSEFGFSRKTEPETLVDWESHLVEEDKEHIILELDRVLNSTESQWEVEYRLLNGNNEIAYVLERGFIIRDANKKPVRMIGSLQDISKIKQNERDLEELNLKLRNRARDLNLSNQELEQFAYIASHDLQEPLRMVTSFLGQLKKKYDNQLDDKAQQYIYFATDGAVRMRQIILDLLEYSRVGRLNYQMERIELDGLVEEILLMHHDTILETKAKINYKNLPTIEEAKTPLLRVLSNLISNALKYHKENSIPVIEIKVENLRDKWEFIISDNGIGINSQFFDKIFIIFQRLHAKENYSGTGIGLAISKKIIENHGGKIWLESTEGKGSNFHFTIKKHF